MHCRPVFICLYVKRINVVCYFARKVVGTRLVNSVLLSLPAEPEYFHRQFSKITLVTHLLFYFILDPPTYLLSIYRRNILSSCSFIIKCLQTSVYYERKIFNYYCCQVDKHQGNKGFLNLPEPPATHNFLRKAGNVFNIRWLVWSAACAAHNQFLQLLLPSYWFLPKIQLMNIFIFVQKSCRKSFTIQQIRKA